MSQRRGPERGIRRPTPPTGAVLVLCSALAGCIDLDALRERAGDAGTDGASTPSSDQDADCVDSDRRAVRFWKLALGQSDYVTLKNTGECSVELGGLRLFFDDLDELLEERGDCDVQLPAGRLRPGAEVRVHEDPLADDISFQENVVGECPSGFSYNPDRGGVSYLCEGACGPDTVIDVVAHAGETYITPPMLFGQTFDAPLAGVTVAKQESGRFHRVATEGAAPSFLSSDWQLETRYVYAGFESKVEVVVDGTARAWLPEEGQSATFSSSEIAAVGNLALSLTHRGSHGRSNGLALELGPREGTPGHISYFTRIDQAAEFGAYFDLQGDGFSAIQASFEPMGFGIELENGKRTQFVATKDTWYQVEFRNIDWPAHTYDLYVDRVLVALGTKFWTNAAAAEKLSLYSVSADTTALWDEIELWRDAAPGPVSD